MKNCLSIIVCFLCFFSVKSEEKQSEEKYTPLHELQEWQEKWDDQFRTEISRDRYEKYREEAKKHHERYFSGVAILASVHPTHVKVGLRDDEPITAFVYGKHQSSLNRHVGKLVFVSGMVKISELSFEKALKSRHRLWSIYNATVTPLTRETTIDKHQHKLLTYFLKKSIARQEATLIRLKEEHQRFIANLSGAARTQAAQKYEQMEKHHSYLRDQYRTHFQTISTRK